MDDSEVHSLILDRVDAIEDDDLRSFLHKVLQHEREIINNPRGQYMDEYESLVEDFVGNTSLDDYDTDE